VPHSLILGMTESGKSTLAKIFAAGFKRRGVKVAVLDPLKYEDWEADFLTDDSDTFLAHAKRETKTVLFIDESSQAIGRYNVPMEWLVTQSRHWGHTAYVISQFWTQLPPVVRGQCAKVYLFACDKDSAEKVAAAFNEPALLQLEKFRPGKFFVVSRFADLLVGQIDWKRRTVTIEPFKKTAGKAVKNEAA
jgi:hypothetical protein